MKLLVFCPYHIPAGFQPDPLTGILYPASITTPLVSLLHLSSSLTRIRSLIASLHDKYLKELEAARSIIQSTHQSVMHMKQRKQNPPRWDKTRHSTSSHHFSSLVLVIDSYSLAPWVATLDGYSGIQEVMTITFTALTPASKRSSFSKHGTMAFSQSQSISEPEEFLPDHVSVSTPEQTATDDREQALSLVSSPLSASVPVLTSVPRRSGSKKKESDSEVEMENESIDEDEWKETEEREVEESPGRSHRTVTSRMIQRMKVAPDDMLIRTHGNSHPVFINVTRLQQLIREEGGILEKDPFIAYLGSVNTSLFVTGNDYDRALKASQRIVGAKVSNDSGNTEPVHEEPKEDPVEKWEIVGDGKVRVRSFAEWLHLLAPAGNNVSSSESAANSHCEISSISDNQAIQEMKFDTRSLRRSTAFRLQTPIESLFSHLLLNRRFPRESSYVDPRTMLSTRVQKSLRSSQTYRQPRLNLLCRDDEERIPAVRAFTAACLLKQVVNVKEKMWLDECLTGDFDSVDTWLTLLNKHIQNSEYFGNNPVSID